MTLCVSPPAPMGGRADTVSEVADSPFLKAPSLSLCYVAAGGRVAGLFVSWRGFVLGRR